MKLYIIIILLSLFFTYSSSYAFNAEVLPSEIKPGDTFLIKVDNINTTHLPIASLNGRRFYFKREGKGCFVAIGSVGMKTKPGIYTIKLKAGKKKKNLHLVVCQFRLPPIELNLPHDKVFLDKKDHNRVRKENKRLNRIFQKVSRNQYKGNFILPLENEVSIPFGVKRILNKKWISIHRGIDILGYNGEEIKASNNGKVVFADELFFGGNTVILDHGLGIYTIYMHLSDFNVKTGENVSKGDTIGFVGSSGRTTGSHLHFGLKVMNMSTNPVSLIELNL